MRTLRGTPIIYVLGAPALIFAIAVVVLIMRFLLGQVAPAEPPGVASASSLPDPLSLARSATASGPPKSESKGEPASKESRRKGVVFDVSKEPSFRGIELTPYPVDLIQPDSERWCRAGPFSTSIERLEHIVSFDPDQGPVGAHLITLSLLLRFDDRVQVLQVSKPPYFSEFLDDKHQPIAVAGKPDTAYIDRFASRAGIDLPLILPASPGTQIAIMRGTIAVHIAAHSETVISTSLTTPFSARVGDLNVEMRSFARDNPFQATPTVTIERYLFSVHYRRGKMDPAKWAKLTPLLPTLIPVVLSATGQPLSSPGTGHMSGLGAAARGGPSGAGGGGPDEVISVNYNVSAGLDHLVPHHVRLEVPTDVRELQVPFEFKDLSFP